MIALKNNNFAKTYASIQPPDSSEMKKNKLLEAHNLNLAILDAVTKELEGKINNKSKEYNWMDKFSFIKTVDFPLDQYKEIISLIQNRIFIPFQNEEKQDILGRAYKIFLSKAGSIDNKNIILTPDHIKCMMVELARLSTDDVVLDTCTGSGGFLMESMEVMLKMASNDKKTENKIKTKQLIGFENDPVLFALACSNMFLHGDGRTNMIYHSSILDMDDKSDADLFKYIKQKKPSKIIINPPYEKNLPIRFVDQAIDFLETNGKLIVIMPTPTLRRNKDGLAMTVLKKAKLEFVIKMPNNLFSEQKRTVNTSIFGFTKTPHHADDDVLFCNMQDDGFVSVQHKGRIDKYGKWDDIKSTIITSIFSSKEIKGVCEKRKIFRNGEFFPSGISKKRRSKKYKLVKFKDLFSWKKGTLASESNEEGEYPFITAGESQKTHNAYTDNCEAIVYAVDAAGSLGKTSYVNGKFIASNLCIVLTPKKKGKYKIDLEFYSHYLESIREEIRSELADGTSKLTIKPKELMEYYIPYIPYEAQKKFVEEHIRPLNKAKEELQQLTNDIDKSLEELY